MEVESNCAQRAAVSSTASAPNDGESQFISSGPSTTPAISVSSGDLTPTGDVRDPTIASSSRAESASDSSGGDSERGSDTRRRKRTKRTTPTSAAVATTESAISGDESKPRKPTYKLRKEEKESLTEEIRLLEARLDLLRVRAGHQPSSTTTNSLASVQESNFELEEAIHSNLLGIARFHSLLARHLHSIPVNPMKTFIHLSKDLPERRATLRAMRDMKIRRALELASDRVRFIDPCKPYSTDERFITDDGTYHCKRFEVIPFEGVTSAKPVFDALLFYLSNMEMTVAGLTGEVTIREDMDVVDPTIWNHRIVTATGDGYFQEINTVAFAQFFEQYEPHDGAQHGVVTADSVDVDDLYPYAPSERVRKDTTSAVTVSEFRHPKTQQLTVVLRRVVFLSIRQPQFPLPASAMEDMRANIATWSTQLVKFLRDSLLTGGS